MANIQCITETVATLLVLGDSSANRGKARRSFFTLLRALLNSTRSVQVVMPNASVVHKGRRGCAKCLGSPVWTVFWLELWTLLDTAAKLGTEAEFLVNMHDDGGTFVTRQCMLT